MHFLLIVNRRFLVTHCPKIIARHLWLTTKMIYSCIFSPCVTTGKLQRMIAMDMFSSSDIKEHGLCENITWHIKSHLCRFSWMQGRPTWIGLWRSTFANYNFFSKVQVHPTSLETQLAFGEKNRLTWMWHFHEYYVDRSPLKKSHSTSPRHCEWVLCGRGHDAFGPMIHQVPSGGLSGPRWWCLPPRRGGIVGLMSFFRGGRL